MIEPREELNSVDEVAQDLHQEAHGSINQMTDRRGPQTPSAHSEIDDSLDDLADDNHADQDDVVQEQPAALETEQSTPASEEATVVNETSPLAAEMEQPRAEPDARSTEPDTLDKPAASSETAQQAADAQANTVSSPTRRGIGLWAALGLILLGLLLGVALTLLVMFVRSGSLAFASRAEVGALSQNLATMYDNQELAWQRQEDLMAQLAEQEQRIVAAETALEAAQQELVTLRQELAARDGDVEALSQQLATVQQATEERMSSVEGQTSALDEGLATLQESVTPLQTEIERHRSFFTSLRDLLTELQSEP